MEKHSLRFLLVYCCFIVSSQNEAREAIAENGVKLQDSEIIEESLYYLNQFSALNADFNFADAKIVGFEKGDSNHVTATLDVNAECLQNIVCKSKVLKCQSSFENYEGLWVHLETTCNDEPLAVEETIQCEGCAVDLNLNAEGLSSLVETALHHIESETRRKPSLYYIARAQREVVNGFKYTLDLVLNGGHLNCKVVFLLKPWQNQNNHITSNNCTQSQEYVEEISNIRENQNALDNTLNPHYKPQLHDKDPTDNVPNFNLMAELGTVEITPDRLRDLESQIIPKDFEGQDPTIESSFNHPMVSSSSFQEVFATEDQPIVGVDQTETITSFTPDFDEEFIPTYADFATSSYPLNDFLNLGQFRGERSVGVLEKITGEDKPIVRDLADFAVSKLDNVGSNDRKRVVLEILGARKVKTRGTYYHIVLKIGVSHCHEDNPEPQCVNMLFEHLSKICKVQVHVDEDKSNPQLVKSQCQNTKRHNINKNRTTRDVSEKDHEIHLGKKTKVGSKDPHLKKYYKHVLDFFDSHSRYPQRFKVVEVLSAYVQIVGGVTYTMKVRVALSDCLKSDYKFVESCGVLAGGEKKVCDIEAYEQFSIVIDVNCRSDEKHETPPPSFGGIIDQPLDDPTALAYIKHSLEHLDSVSSETNKYKLKEVISVTKQVVAGYLWRIKARIVISNCAKTDPKRSSECGELSGKKPHVSNIKVWDKPGKKDPEITVTFEADGKEHVFKGNMGGIEVRKVNDPEAVEYVKKTLYDIDFASHKSFKYKLLEIISVTMQVVEGTLWRIRFRILPSECKKTEHKEIEKCGFLTGALPRVCNAEVWDRPWITRNGLNITVVCENENVPVRRKREVSEILGGVSKIDPKDSSLQKFYKYTLEYLDSVSTHVYRYKLVEVLSATQQVVAGMSYNLKVKIALSECLKTETKDLETCGILPNGENKVCDILGLDQPWISFAHVIVKCDQDEEKSFKIERDPSTRKYKIKSKRSIAGGIEYELRSKREVGGVETRPIHDPEAAEYVKKTLGNINDISDKRNKYIVTYIFSVTRQVVEGARWKIKFEVILSDCLKTDTKKIHECKPLLGAIPRICNAEIWDRPWIKPNGLQITATFEDDNKEHVFRSKRSVNENLVGGKQQIDPIDPTLDAYYEYSLKYLDSVSNYTYRYKFTQFISADVQVVNGISYNMKTRIALSDCLKSDQRKNVESCNELQNEKEKVCDIHAFDQPGILVTVINLKCQDVKEKFPNFGGITALPLNDSTALKYIKKSIEDMDATSNQTNKYKLKEVLSVTSQVVAGFLYRIKAKIILSSCPKTDPTPSSECNDLSEEPLIWNIRAWDKPGDKGLEISITFETDRNQHVVKKDKKLGGIEDRPVSDPEALKYVRNTLPHINYVSNFRPPYILMDVLSVTLQVVEGSLWRISFRIIASDCLKSDKGKDCMYLPGASPLVCNAEIWDRPWIRPNGLKTVVVCAEGKDHPYRRKREVSEIPGGISKIDPKDYSLQKFYKYTLEYLDSVSTQVYRYKLVEVLSATQQIVAGISYKLKVKIALSECLKTETKDLETCGILPNGENKVCDILGWDKPWKSFAQVTVKCDQDEEKSFKIERDPSTRKYKIKSKRSIAGGTEYELRSKRKVGGEEDVPIDDPEAAEYLKKTLDYINDISDKRYKYIALDITLVTRQAVEGALWKIDFEVILSDCLKTDTKKIHECKPLLGLTPRICNAEIWDRPWIKPNGLQITANIINDYEEQVFRSKRSVTKDLVGGKQKINPIDPTLNTYYEYSLNYLDSVSNHTYRYKFIQFRSADVQVVNGISYNMKAKIALSDCLKSDLRKNFESCNVLQNEKEKVCDIHALDQPGVLVTVIDLECQDDEEKALLTGGITALPLNDSTALKHIKKSIEDMDATSNQTNKYKLKEVLSVTIQVVAGFLYRIKANIILSSCPKTDPTPSSECNDLNAEPLIWNIIAWEKPEGGVQISITFETGRDRYVFKKDKKPGGIEDRPVNDPDAIKYVRNTLPHIDYASGLRNTYKVREILSVTVQAMEGSLWKISFKIVLSNCTKTDTEKGCEELEGATARICNAEIWDRPWMTPKSLKTIVVCAPWDKHPYRRKREVSGKHIEIETDSKTEKKKVTSKRSIASEELIRSKRSIAGGFENRSPAAVNYHNPIRHKIDVIYRGKTSEFNTKDHLKKKGYPKKYRSKYNTEILLSMFHEFMNKYNKKYVNRVEYKRRFDIFRKNMKFVQVLKKHEQGTAKYGMTQFADLSRKEFSKMLGYRTDLRNENELEFLQAQIPDVDLPDKFDWREKAAVSEVKNQGSCGSCWAFSVTGNVEGQYALKYGKLLEFSEQELVDCDTMDDGCGGGLMDNAYRMIEKLGGLEEEKDYPYEAENEKCHFNKSLAHVQLSGALNISHDETDMAKWLVKNGPISIAINANAMQFYMGGVSHPWKFLCNPTSLDHGVLIVGYGEDRYPKFKKNLPYWIVKNSWGKRWGEQGYYRVYRGDGTCGVNQTPSSAIVA